MAVNFFSMHQVLEVVLLHARCGTGASGLQSIRMGSLSIGQVGWFAYEDSQGEMPCGADAATL